MRFGFQGDWCDLETDECSSAPCGVLEDCLDLPGHFRCDLNVLKVAAIVCGCLAALLLAGLALDLRKRVARRGRGRGRHTEAAADAGQAEFPFASPVGGARV